MNILSDQKKFTKINLKNRKLENYWISLSTKKNMLFSKNLLILTVWQKKKQVVGNCIADQVFMYGLCKVLKASVENYQLFPTVLSDSHFVSDRTLFKHYLNIF